MGLNGSYDVDEGISVVIPVYQSEEILPILTRRLVSVFSALSEKYEILFVNDGSQDASWAVIQKLASENQDIRGINLMRNYGQHNALYTGILSARYGLIVTMDDDLQHPPEEIPRLLKTLRKEGAEVVYGVPHQEAHGMCRVLASRMLKWTMAKALGLPNVPKSGAFRLFRSSVRKAFTNYRAPFLSIDVLLGWGASRFGYVLVRHEGRYAGASHYTFWRLVKHTLNMVVGFSTLPLRLASLLGFGFTLVGVGILLYVVVRYFVNRSPVPGFTFLASMIALFSGVQLFVFGIFGEYLARMYFALLGRPISMVRETVGFDAEGGSSDHDHPFTHR